MSGGDGHKGKGTGDYRPPKPVVVVQLSAITALVGVAAIDALTFDWSVPKEWYYALVAIVVGQGLGVIKTIK